MKAYTDHPIANIFPLLEADKLAELAADIREHGLKQDITLYDGQILDGRNRYRACLQAGVTPTFVVYAGNDAVGHVLSLNLHRRHLTASQLATVATESLPHYEAEAKKRQRASGGDTRAVMARLPEPLSGIVARDQAAAAVGVSPRYVSDAKRVKAEAPEIFEQVKAGEVTLPQAIKTLREEKPPAEQKISVVIAEGRRIWAVAKLKLDTIGKADAERVEVLKEMIRYAQQRLEEGM